MSKESAENDITKLFRDKNKQTIGELNFCVDALARFLGIKYQGRVEMAVGYNETASFIHESNNIRLPQNPKSGTYFHEAAHFLREDALPGSGRMVHEFFAKVGEKIGSDLLVDSPFAYLLENYSSSIDWDVREFEEYVRTALKLHCLEGQKEPLKLAYMNSLKILDVMEEDLDSLSGLAKSFGQDNDFSALEQGIKRNEEEWLKKPSNIEWTPRLLYADLEYINKHHDERPNVLSMLRKYMGKARTMEDEGARFVDGDDDPSEFFASMMRATISLSLGKHARDYRKELDDVRHVLGVLDLEANYGFEEGHLVGYVCAEDFVRRNPDYKKQLPSLFRQSDGFIEENFLKMEILRPYIDVVKKAVVEKGYTLEKSA